MTTEDIPRFIFHRPDPSKHLRHSDAVCRMANCGQTSVCELIINDAYMTRYLSLCQRCLDALVAELQKAEP